MMINIDNGGTFTDVCVIDGETVYRVKTPTTPFDLSECFFEGIRKVSREVLGTDDVQRLLASTDVIRYSTTQGTNALVERKGPRLGVIADETWDTLEAEASGEAREMLDALIGNRVARLVDDPDDESSERSVVEAVNRLTYAGANRVVLSLTSRELERRAGRVIRRRFPEHLLGTVPVLMSSEVTHNPDPIRRTWTAIFNSFLHPSMEKFLYHAQNRLQDYKFRSPLLIYRNDGDSGRVAKTTAIKTYSSGPRGGLDGAQALATHYGFQELLTMDVGGTTTDIGQVTAAGIRQQMQGRVAGAPVALSLCDIAAVGVGGGSIIHASGQTIQVGPESTGAVPGPACFGLGGTEATITDFALLAGIIDPATYFAGTMKLDRERAEAAVQSHVAQPLGLSLEDALLAMEKAWVGKIAAALLEFAKPSAETVLAAFGGAGPLAVCAVAEQAGIGRVIVPRMAAAFCALGIAFSDIGHSYEAHLRAGSSADDLESELRALRERARKDMYAEGFDLDACEVHSWITLGVNGTATKVRADDLRSATAALRESAGAVLHLRAHRQLPHPSLAGGAEGRRASKLQVASSREVLNAHGQRDSIPYYRVDDQVAGARGQGPAIVEDDFFTLRVPHGWTLELSSNLDLILTRKAQRGPR